ncbi:MAG: antibiotic biosynthesis monooxygenase [Vicinamibacterales bacterium]
MVVIIFRSRLVDEPDGYAAMAQEMADTARAMPGFVDMKSFKADDGERVTLVWWQDEETLAGWRQHARHRLAQQLGRERWYQEYTIDVAHVVRHNAFGR